MGEGQGFGLDGAIATRRCDVAEFPSCKRARRYNRGSSNTWSNLMKVLSDADIKTFLETAPLYSWREFKKPLANRSSLWIGEIDSYCDICQQPRPFQDLRARGGGAGMAVRALESGTSYFSFSCVSCRKAHREYLVEQVLDDESIRLQKYGERPQSKLVRSRVLRKFLKDDLDNYEKAVVCLAHEYGVAAFAYFRRVIENNISSLLDLVQEDAQSSGSDKAILDALAELRKATPMSERIKIANLALPNYLKPDGLNPLGRLYQVLSEGIHSLPEADCLKKAAATSECLEFLVSELASRREHRTRFKKLVGDL